MSDVIDELMNLTVTVTSPDKRVMAADRDRGLIEFKFRELPCLADYRSPEALAHQICAAVNGVITGRRRAFHDGLLRKGWTPVNPNEIDADRRRYRKALSETISRGQSPGGYVRIEILGDHVDHNVQIHPATLDALDDGQFLQELHGAYRRAAGDLQRRRAELKQRHLRS